MEVWKMIVLLNWVMFWGAGRSFSGVYLQLVDFYGINVGKDTNPMQS